MHVTFVTRGDLFPAHHGAAVRILRVAEAYARLGAGVSLVDDDPDAYFRYDAGAFLRVAYPARARAAVEWPPLPRWRRWQDRFLRRFGYPEEELFLYRPLVDPGWWIRTLAVGRREHTDVFQAEFPGYTAPALFAARMLRRRVCVVEHNVEWDRLAQTTGLHPRRLARLRALESTLLGRVDDIFTMNAEDKARLVTAGIPAQRVSVVPHGVDLEAYEGVTGAAVRARHGLGPDVPLLFFHGVLHYAPNARAVVRIVEEILPRLLLRRPPLKVMITGMSPPRWYAHPAVIFTGEVEDLPEHVAACDVAICPLDQGGGTRMKLLEYFAAGKAVVSTRKGAEGLRCEDGREVLLRDGTEDFCEAVEQCLDNPGFARTLGAHARRFAGRYPWNAVGEAGLAIFRGEGRGEDWNERFLSPLGHRGGFEPGPAPDTHLPAGRDVQPLTLLLMVLRGCNLRCAFCDIPTSSARMDFTTQVLPLLREARGIGTRNLVITGGEPLLHPDVGCMIEAATRLGMGTNLTTNGLLLPARYAELRASGLHSLGVSIDGIGATHDALRGQEGAFDAAFRAIQFVSERGEIGLAVNMTVTATNVGEILAVWELANRHGASFDLWPVQDAPSLALSSPSHAEAWRQAIERLGVLDPAIEERRAYLLGALTGGGGAVRCLGLVDQYGVLWDGSLLPCCQWGRRGLVVGNVFETPLHELWRGPEARALRHRIFTEGCGGACYNHSLHLFQRSTGLDFHVTP